MKRIITALVFIPAFYLYVMKLPAGYFFGLISIIGLVGLYEFYSMFKLKPGLTLLGIIIGFLFLYGSYIGIFYSAGSFGGEVTGYSILRILFSPLELIGISFIIIASFRLIARRDPFLAIKEVGLTITGLVYIIFLLTFQMKLRQAEPHWIIYLYGVIWLSDSSAYYIGTYFGKRKLYPEISPNKTVEGAIASLIGGVVGSFVLGGLLKPFTGLRYLSPDDLLILGVLIGLLCVIGDLIESMFKRDAGIKDSSNLIPGHGGVLDKIDSALVVAPFVYWYIML